MQGSSTESSIEVNWTGLKERNISHGYIRVTARKVIKRPTTDGYITSARNIAEKSSITESVVPSTTELL